MNSSTSVKATTTDAQTEINARALSTEHLLPDLGRRSARGIIITMAAQAGMIILQIANMVFMARLLRPDEFGVVALALAASGFIGLFAELGLSAASIQQERLDQNTASVLFQINLLCGICGMFACLLLAWPMANAYGDPRLAGALVGMGAIMPISAASVQYSALLARSMRWFALQGIGLSALAASIAAGVLAASLFDAGYWALIAAGAAQAVTRLLGSLIASGWRPSLRSEWSRARGALRFGAFLTGFNVTNFLARQIDVLLIGWFWGAAETGYYNRAYQLMLFPLNAIAGPLASVLVPALSRLNNDPCRWREAFLRAYLASAVVGCAVGAVLIATADPLVSIVLGPGWEKTATIFQWLCGSIFCTFPMGAMAWSFISRGRSKAMFHWGLTSLAVLIAVFALAVPHGTVTLAAAFTLALWTLTPVCYWFALRGSPLSTRQALMVILPIWLAAASGTGTGLAVNDLITWAGPFAQVALQAAIALATFLAVLGATILLRPDYRAVLGAVWRLIGVARGADVT